MFGEGQRKLLLWDASRKISGRQTEFFGSRDETKDFIHVEDAAALIQLDAMQAPQGEISVISGGTGQSATVRTNIEELVQLLNCELIPIINGRLILVIHHTIWLTSPRPYVGGGNR